MEAADLADEYVLIHKSHLGEMVRETAVHTDNGDRLAVHTGGSSGRRSQGRTGKGDNLCNYCREAGHWKADCPLLRVKKQHVRGGHVKPAALAASLPSSEVVGPQRLRPDLGMADSKCKSYQPFVREGFVTLPDGDKKVSVKVLRDTGAFNSYVLESVLPFSRD